MFSLPLRLQRYVTAECACEGADPASANVAPPEDIVFSFSEERGTSGSAQAAPRQAASRQRPGQRRGIAKAAPKQRPGNVQAASRQCAGSAQANWATTNSPEVALAGIQIRFELAQT